MSLLPVRRACDLDDRSQQQRWLIEGLWADSAVGIIGGEPKCCKSFLALDAAVSVASGTPCLRRFAAGPPGPALVYAAEDALDVVRRRLLGIASTAGVPFRSLDVHVITVPRLRLDAAAEVAPLLAYLRELQREHQVAVMLVHHARKGAGRIRAGQALRGSSELHAWGDSNLYLRRRSDDLALSIEHRAAPSPDDLRLALRGEGDNVALHVLGQHEADEVTVTEPLADRIVAVLAEAESSMTWREIRQACRVRAATLGDTLRTLEARRTITRSKDGYRLVRPEHGVSASRVPLHTTGNGNRKHNELPGETEAGSAGVQPAKG